jgi:hypothetical protein
MKVGAGTFMVTAMPGDRTVPPVVNSVDVPSSSPSLTFVFPAVDGAPALTGQLIKKDFKLSLRVRLEPGDRCVRHAVLMFWEDIKGCFTPQFRESVGATSKAVRLAFGSLHEAAFGLSEVEAVLQIQERDWFRKRRRA